MKGTMEMKKERISMTAVILVLLTLVGTIAADQKGKACVNENEFEPGQLSPRPVVVAGAKELQVNLGGRWRFNASAPNDFWKLGSSTSAGLSDIEVPGEWVMQGFEAPNDVAVGYRRGFKVPADWREGRVKLRCDGVYSDGRVWINGKEAGGHIGGFTPFELEVTELINFEGGNVIALAVKNESLADKLASGTYYANHKLGGITRKICLFTVPTLNIATFDVATTFDKKFRDATVEVTLETANEGKEDIENAVVQFRLRDGDGKEVKIKPNKLKIASLKAGQTIKQSAKISVKAPKKWDAEHPNLYVLSCELKSGGKSLETVERRFGFRQVEIRGRQLFVNNRPVKLHGVCRHETHPLRGRSLTPEICRKDAELFRNANVNFVRTSHYPPSEEFLDACDELGIFVEDEAPFCWAFRWDESKKNDPNYSEPIVRQTLEMVQRDRNHPCVIIWSAANESNWGTNFECSAEAIRRADASRPRIFSYSHKLEIMSHHYPGVEISDELSTLEGPVLFDEYMHLNCYNRDELVTDPGVREDWGRAFVRVWEKMNTAKACVGGSIWAGIDDIFYLPSGKATGYGPWGPLDGWRRAKPEYWHVKKAYSPVQVLTKTIAVPKAGKPIKLEVENRYDFTNLNEVSIEWKAGPESGRVKADIAPRKKGTISIPVKSCGLDGRELSLEFLSPRGFVIDSYLLPIGGIKTTMPAASKPASGKLELAASDADYTIKSERFTWVFDRKSGQIRSGEIDGHKVFEGGPVLMVLPFGKGRCEPNYSDDTAAFNPTCSQWRAEEIIAKESAEGVEVLVKGQYKEASGDYKMLVNKAGQLIVSYMFTYQQEPEPTQHMWNNEPDAPSYRQMGIVLDFPKSADTLSWERKALWNVYPEDHIGRASGEAKAFRSGKGPQKQTHTEPSWPWSLDENAMGTNDFRSTKRNILWSALKDDEGYGVLVRSDGRQSTRSYVDGDRVRMLVAGYSTGGRDSTSFGHLGDERRILEKGSVFEDTVCVELISPIAATNPPQADKNPKSEIRNKSELPKFEFSKQQRNGVQSTPYKKVEG
jgi:hypothetical protein